MRIAVVLILLSCSILNASEIESALPCMTIRKACKKNDSQLSAKECMSKILKGEKVEGVLIEPSIINSCTEKHEK